MGVRRPGNHLTRTTQCTVPTYDDDIDQEGGDRRDVVLTAEASVTRHRWMPNLQVHSL